MKSNFKVFVAIVSLALVSLACQALSQVKTGDTPNVPNSAKVILSDDFSSETWGTISNSNSNVQYVSNALQMIVYTKNWFVWSTPGDDSYSNVHMEATVVNNDTDSTTAFGFICDKGDGDNFYYLVMTPAGEYAIAKAVDGQNDLFLTNNDQWAKSDLIPVKASSYRVSADCGNNTLTLYVNGQQIDSVVDSTYVSGKVALLTWSGEEATNTNISFDDFLMTALGQ